ncbi:MAG: SCO family protein [Ilumatobacteraceae bacterium]
MAALVLTIGIGVGVARSGELDGPSAYVELPVPVPLPSAALIDTDGRPYDLRDHLAGRMTLLFFGYTNCPDACPIQLAVLAKSFDALPSDVRARLSVVFVTTDPGRDTPERLRQYLDGFDSSFVGLTGSVGELSDLQIAAGVPVAVAEQPATDGTYLVGHATQVLVFEEDGFARRAYPFGVRQSDWVHDLPYLAAQVGS